MQYRIPEVADLFYKVGFLRGVEVIAPDLRPAGERDGIRPRDREAAATLLFSGVTRWLMQEGSVHPVVSLNEMDINADRAVDRLMLACAAW